MLEIRVDTRNLVPMILPNTPTKKSPFPDRFGVVYTNLESRPEPGCHPDLFFISSGRYYTSQHC